MRIARPDWLRDHKIVPLWQLSLSKHKDLQHIPLALEFARSEEDRQIMEFFFARQEMSRPFLTTPGVAPERLQALRSAFMKTAVDPEFIEATKDQDVELDPIDGEAIEALIRKVYASPQRVIERASEIAQSAGSEMASDVKPGTKPR